MRDVHFRAQNQSPLDTQALLTSSTTISSPGVTPFVPSAASAVAPTLGAGSCSAAGDAAAGAPGSSCFESKSAATSGGACALGSPTSRSLAILSQAPTRDGSGRGVYLLVLVGGCCGAAARSGAKGTPSKAGTGGGRDEVPSGRGGTRGDGEGERGEVSIPARRRDAKKKVVRDPCARGHPPDRIATRAMAELGDLLTGGSSKPKVPTHMLQNLPHCIFVCFESNLLTNTYPHALLSTP